MQLVIKDKSRKLVWGTGCFEDVCDRLGVSLVDLDLLMLENQEKTLREITYSALRNGADIEDEELDFNYRFFVNWLDNEPQGTAAAIMEDHLASKILGKTMKEYYEENIARLDTGEPETTKKASKKKSSVSEK